MHELHQDFETASKVDLKKVGLDVYSRHPSTKVLMLGWSVDDGPQRLWLPHREEMPSELRRAQLDPTYRKIAHNAPFEIAIFRNVLKIPTPAEQWYCTMVMALSLGLPAALAQLVRDALKLAPEYHKDPEGDRLMKMFSFPSSKATWQSHPAEFEAYGRYCMQDVRAEHKTYKVLKKYIPNMGQLFDIWNRNERINANGLPIDMDFVDSAIHIRDISKAEYAKKLKEMTGLDNPNSNPQMLGYLRDLGYPFASIAKNRAQIAIKDFGERIDDQAVDVLKVRFESNKTSLAKYDALKAFTVLGRLRNTFLCRGAAATGRYAGRIIGQNMPRPWDGVEDYLAEAREMVQWHDLDEIKFWFGRPLEVLATLIRAAIAPPPGKRLLVADYAAIELVVIAWLTRCEFWLNVIEAGLDPYKAFASRWLGIAYELVTKAMRKLSKPPTLGCGYRMGPGREVGAYPDTEKTGLWGYAANMGVDMLKEQCKDAVKIYRELSPEIKQSWYDMENAAMNCVQTGEPQTCGLISFDMRPPFLRMRLPSGRFIHYCRPRIEESAIEYEDEETGETVTSYKLGITYERLSQTSNKWVRRNNHGGRFIEQAVQGIALDLLDFGLENAEKAGFEIVGHYHDEILALVDEDSPLTHHDLIFHMTKLPAWAHGMTVRAAGYESKFYKKD